MPKRLASVFVWAMGFACIAGTEAGEPPACTVVSSAGKEQWKGQAFDGSCGELTSSASEIDKQSFQSSSMSDMYVKYSTSALQLGMMALKQTPTSSRSSETCSGDLTVHMECGGGTSCASPSACTADTGDNVNNAVACAACTTRQIDGGFKWANNACGLTFKTYCGGTPLAGAGLLDYLSVHARKRAPEKA